MYDLFFKMQSGCDLLNKITMNLELTSPVSKQKKLFVLDTNVILHDPSCIYHFTHHDIILPITVIEELDNFHAERLRDGR